jgi:hypothetical protein
MHTIRLREPWEQETAAAVVRWRRWFNRPTGLEPDAVVELHIKGLCSAAQVRLNGTPLASVGVEQETTSFDLVPLLAQRNELVVEVANHAAATDRPFGEVCLQLG